MKRLKFKELFLLVVSFSLLYYGCSEPTSTEEKPKIISISPEIGHPGTEVTITGSGFAAYNAATSKVYFNGVLVTDFVKVDDVVQWTDDAIQVIVPQGATTGNVIVEVKGSKSNGIIFDVPNIYFPLVVGSWWTYTNDEYDENENKVSGTNFISKYLFNNQETKDGKLAAIFDIQDLGGGKIEDSKFYYTTTTQVFHHSTLLPQMDFQFPIDIPNTWYKFADEKGTSWTIFSQFIDNKEFTIGVFTVVLKDTLKIVVTNKGFETISYGENLSQSVVARKYSIDFVYKGKVGFFGNDIEVPFTVETSYYYAENIGLLKYEMKYFEINYNASVLHKQNGVEQVLLNYSIPE